MCTSILILNDEKEMLDHLTSMFRGEFEIITATDGEEALRRLRERDFDLCLPDIMMPGRDGIDVLKAMQEEEIDVPVIFLTAREKTEDRVKGRRGEICPRCGVSLDARWSFCPRCGTQEREGRISPGKERDAGEGRP